MEIGGGIYNQQCLDLWILYGDMIQQEWVCHQYTIAGDGYAGYA